MKKIKLLIEMIKTNTKAQIITGIVSVAVITVGVVGVLAYNKSIENAKPEASKSDIVQVKEEEKELVNKLEDQIDNGELTVEEVDKLIADGKLSEETANKVKERVEQKEIAKENGTTIPSGNGNPNNSANGEKPNDSGTSTPSTPNPAPPNTPDSTPTPPVVQPTPPAQPSNELTTIGYARGNRNFALGGAPFHDKLGVDLSKTTVNVTKQRLLEMACEDIAHEIATFDTVKNYMVGKTIDGKYKISNIKYSNSSVAAMGFGVLEEDYIRDVKNSISSIAPSTSVYMDKVFAFQNDNDRSNDVIRRVIIELVNI